MATTAMMALRGLLQALDRQAANQIGACPVCGMAKNPHAENQACARNVARQRYRELRRQQGEQEADRE